MLTSPVCSIHSVDPTCVQRYRGLLLFRQYYLEGGWGYLVLFAAFLTVLMTSGVQTSMELISSDVSTRFKIVFDANNDATGKKLMS